MSLNLDYFRTVLNGIKQYVQNVTDNKIKDNVPDWNQNDPDGKGYIENRPFYTEEAKSIVTELGNTYEDWAKIVNAPYESQSVAISIKCNGVIYQNITPTSGYGGGTNYRYYSLDNGKFLITVGFASGNGYVSCSPKAEFQFVSIKDCKDEVVHTLDSKYIEDMYYTEIITNNVTGTVIEEVPRADNHTLNLPFGLGQLWDADFGTTTYQNIPVRQSADGTFYIGDPTVTSYPFYIPANGESISNSRWASMMQPALLATLTCVSGFVENEKIHKIPDKYYDKASAFIINTLTFDIEDDGKSATFTIDKTYDEILAAYNEGKNIGLLVNGLYVALNHYNLSSFCFMQISSTQPPFIDIISYYIYQDSCETYHDVQITFGTEHSSAIGKIPRVAGEEDGVPIQWEWVDYGGMFAINITYDSTNKTYSADKTYDEIVSARDSGLIPVCKMQRDVTSSYAYGYCYYTEEVKPPIGANSLYFRNIVMGGENYQHDVTVGISSSNGVEVISSSPTMSYDKNSGRVTTGYVPNSSVLTLNYFLRGDATWQPVLQPPSTASVGQYLSVKSVDDKGIVSEVEAVDAPNEGDTSLGLTGATVGQTVKIAAVDENGVPTEWVPVDMPSGGDELQHLRTISITTDDVNSIYINEDSNGKPFEIKNKMVLFMHTSGDNTGSTSSGLFLRAGDGTVGNVEQYHYPIVANSTGKNYVSNFIITAYRVGNIWIADFVFNRSASDMLYRFVPKDNTGPNDASIREIKLLWNNAQVFFRNGMTIEVFGT